MCRKAAYVKENFDDRRKVSCICLASLDSLMSLSLKACNAYVVYMDRETATKAAKGLNGTVFAGHHLHTDMADNEAVPDHRRSVFIGNLPLDIEEVAVTAWRLT